jgi:hypothetical protein
MRRPLLATALAVTLIIGFAIALRVTLLVQTPVEDIDPLADIPRSTPAPAAQTPRPAPQPKAEAQPAPPAKTKTKRATAPEPSATPTTTGNVRLSVLPWGEVYVDDRKIGVAPPLRDIALKPGKHRIEVRNPGFASYVQLVDVEAGEEIRIVHRFR